MVPSGFLYPGVSVSGQSTGGILSSVTRLVDATALLLVACRDPDPDPGPAAAAFRDDIGGGCIGVSDAEAPSAALSRLAGFGVCAFRLAASEGVTGIPDPAGGCSSREVLLRGGMSGFWSCDTRKGADVKGAM